MIYYLLPNVNKKHFKKPQEIRHGIGIDIYFVEKNFLHFQTAHKRHRTGVWNDIFLTKILFLAIILVKNIKTLL